MNRLETIVSDLVTGMRAVLEKHDVTFEEYRAAVGFILKTAEAGEIPLLMDVFLNTTVSHIEGRLFGGSNPSIEGPYYLEGAPMVTDQLALRPEDRGQPEMLMRGTVTDEGGRPIAGAIVDIWHSTPDGRYSGIHDDIPLAYYRGRVQTGPNGSYSVRSVQPVAYEIPSNGPTGGLLRAMGRHSWRPAHIHYKIFAPNMHTLISQAYFEGGDYVGNDCCEDSLDGHVIPEHYENGIRVMRMDFRLAREQLIRAA